jgi:hypothetical protein
MSKLLSWIGCHDRSSNSDSSFYACKFIEGFVILSIFKKKALMTKKKKVGSIRFLPKDVQIHTKLKYSRLVLALKNFFLPIDSPVKFHFGPLKLFGIYFLK